MPFIKVFSLLLFLFLSACGPDKRSPDYSDKTTTDRKEEKEIPSDSKDSGKLSLKKINECFYYPNHRTQPDWSDYLETMQPDSIALEKVEERQSLETFYRTKGKDLKQKVLFKDQSLTTSLPVEKYYLKAVYSEQEVADCSYPKVKIYKTKDDKKIFWVGEWDTKTFYQAEHIVFNKKDLWIHLKQNGTSHFPHPLYKEKIKEEEKSVFLRPLFGSFNLKVQDHSRFDLADDFRLIITERYGTTIGNLSFYWSGKKHDFQYFLGNLDVYIWQKSVEESVYQLEWTMNGPQFKYDEDGEKSRAASGNFDKSLNQIRLYYINPDSEEEMDFLLEFHDLLEDQELVFSGIYSPHF